MSALEKIIDFCFEKFWNTLLLSVFSILLCIIGLVASSAVFYGISFFVAMFSVILSLLSIVYQALTKQWKPLVVTIAVLILTILIFLFSSVIQFFKAQRQPDGFADNLPVLGNVVLNIPSEFNDRKAKERKTCLDSEIQDLFQSGTY